MVFVICVNILYIINNNHSLSKQCSRLEMFFQVINTTVFYRESAGLDSPPGGGGGPFCALTFKKLSLLNVM